MIAGTTNSPFPTPIPGLKFGWASHWLRGKKSPPLQVGSSRKKSSIENSICDIDEIHMSIIKIDTRACLPQYSAPASSILLTSNCSGIQPQPRTQYNLPSPDSIITCEVDTLYFWVISNVAVIKLSITISKHEEKSWFFHIDICCRR